MAQASAGARISVGKSLIREIQTASLLSGEELTVSVGKADFSL